MKVCIVGASGKLGQYMVRHCLERGYELSGVCRAQSVGKLDRFKGHIRIVPGATNDRDAIAQAVQGCDGVLSVLVPWGVKGYSTGTAQAVLDSAKPDARLIFSCGWHITKDGMDVYSWQLKALVATFGPIARLLRYADLDDQVEACRRIFASDKRWTVVRGSDLEEGESEGLPVWAPHVGNPVLASNRTRRIDFEHPRELRSHHFVRRASDATVTFKELYRCLEPGELLPAPRTRALRRAGACHGLTASRRPWTPARPLSPPRRRLTGSRPAACFARWPMSRVDGLYLLANEGEQPAYAKALLAGPPRAERSMGRFTPDGEPTHSLVSACGCLHRGPQADLLKATNNVRFEDVMRPPA